jgi:hypothetical protein
MCVVSGGVNNIEFGKLMLCAGKIAVCSEIQIRDKNSLYRKM